MYSISSDPCIINADSEKNNRGLLPNLETNFLLRICVYLSIIFVIILAWVYEGKIIILITLSDLAT